MKSVVTGGAGFIGTHLMHTLQEQGHEVAVVDLKTGSDILDTRALALACAGADVLYHLAAVASVQKSMEDPLSTHQTNVDGLLNVLEAARTFKIKKVVFASSAAVYGSGAPVPTPEDAPLSPESPYGLHKLMGEQYMALYRALWGIDTTSLRFFNVYGPGQQADSPYAGVVSKFIELAHKGAQPTIYGDGSNTRDFVHVRDVVAAIIAAGAARVHGPFNIGTGASISVLELARAVWAAAGRECVPIFAPAKSGDILASTAIVAHAKQELGWEAKVAFADGIKELVTK